jgi:hydrogenase maturation protease
MRIAVLGIGQTLRGDDGAGPEAVRLWSAGFLLPLPGHILRHDILETPGLGLIDSLQECDSALLVDAVSTGKPPGTLSVFAPIPETGLSAAEKTAHGFGVAETLTLARRSGQRLPDRLVLLGIEGEQYELGKGMSDPVRAVLPRAAAEIQRIISEFVG